MQARGTFSTFSELPASTHNSMIVHSQGLWRFAPTANGNHHELYKNPYLNQTRSSGENN